MCEMNKIDLIAEGLDNEMYKNIVNNELKSII